LALLNFFSPSNALPIAVSAGIFTLPRSRNRASTCKIARNFTIRIPTAPIPVHPPVDVPHSIQNTPHTVAKFLLTLKIEGVQTQSFFGTFKVFPVGAASGAQA
jgi:hypothetical protein